MTAPNAERRRSLVESTRSRVGRFGSASAIICVSQAITMISGIICIRLLTVQEYGVYLLGLAVIQTGVLLTDLGVTGSATALIAGSDDPCEAMERVRREMVVLRTLLLIGWVIALAVIYPWYSPMRRTEVDVIITPLHLSIVSAALFSMIWFHSEAAVYRGLAALQEVAIMDVGTAMLRAAFTIGSIAIVPTGVGGLVGILLSYIAASLVVGYGLKRKTVTMATGTKRIAQPFQFFPAKTLRTMFAPLVLPTIFFAIQSYAATFLMVQRGTIADVAVYGAASRFSQVFAILSGVNTSVLQPYISRLQPNRDWGKITCGIIGCTVLVILVTVSAASISSAQLVLLLGKQYFVYAHLIPLAFIGSSLYFLGSIAYGILIARGQTAGQWLTIPFGIAGVAAGIVVVDPHTASDFMLFEAIRCGAYLLCQMALLIRWLYRQENG